MVCQRIGHGGASALARANTLASFDAACEIGVDMVEFDVRAWNGGLCSRTPCSTPGAAGTCAWARPSRICGPSGRAERRRQAHRMRVRTARIRAPRRAAGPDADLLAGARRGRPRPRARATGLSRISVGGRFARFSRRWRDWRAVALAGIQSGRWDVLMAQHKLVDRGLLRDVGDGVGGCTRGP